MAYLTQRIVRPERMDDPAADPAQLAASLDHLERINRRLGGTRAVLHATGRLLEAAVERNGPLRFLDVGTGSGDLPRAVVDWAQRQDREIEVVGVDLHPTTSAIARTRCEPFEQIQILQADALQLMEHFEPDSFDVVHAGLFLHHLDDMDVMTVLRIMQRLARSGLIWNDLIRSRLTKLAIRPFALLSPPMARHDAMASAGAGFTKREAVDLATRVGWSGVRYRSVLLHRFLLMATP